jgi:hypothetical protein
LIWLLGGLWWRWPGAGSPAWGPIVPDLLAFLLFLILGWHAFGPPIRF